MLKRSILWMAIGCFLASMALAACGRSSAPGSGHDGIVFGFQKSGVPFLAKTRGEFEKRMDARGIGPVKWVEFASGPPLIEAMRAGAVDIGLVGDTPVVYAQVAKADLSYVAAQSFPGLVGSGLLVKSDSPARAFVDLKGKRIAFTKGSASEYVLALSLQRSEMTLADIHPVNLAPADAGAALANGAIDAWLTWDPYFTMALLRGGGREIVLPTSQVRTVNLYVAAGAFVRDRPDVLRATLDELRAEAAWGNAHRTFYRDAVAKATRLPPAVLNGMLDRYKVALFEVDPIGPAQIANQQQVSDSLYRSNVIPVKVDAAKAAWTGWIPKP
jgi:sulfonate transport system substrate-binding protein